MSKNIGIVCEGPTDYVLLTAVIDKIIGEDNEFYLLQPEDNLSGEYGNGWKGVWKWCNDHAEILERYMKDMEPKLDIIVVQMDGDVSRKEKEVHCRCEPTVCELKGKENPIKCMKLKEGFCPVILPCAVHHAPPEGYICHLEDMITSWLKREKDICVVIPCDSTDTWVVAAYDDFPDVEMMEDVWNNVISKGKMYHNIRIPGHKKRIGIYRQFTDMVCDNWDKVKTSCVSAKYFEDRIKTCC